MPILFRESILGIFESNNQIEIGYLSRPLFLCAGPAD